MRNLLSPLLLATVLSCTHAPAPFVFGVSSVTPAATGSVRATVGANGNTVLKIAVQHLSPPDRVVPGATVYVVWARQLDSDSPPTSLGALRVDDQLAGRLDSLTVFRAFDLSITAEPMATVAQPTGKIVLDTRITPQG